MANEFVARRGIIAQSGGARITGSLLVSGTIDASGYNIIASSLTGSFSGSIGTAVSASFATTASYAANATLPSGVVSSSTQIQTLLPSNTVSASVLSSPSQGTVRLTTNGAATDVDTGLQVGDTPLFAGLNVSGSINLASNGQIRILNNTENTLFGFYDGANILGAYYQMWGNNHASTNQRGTAEFVFDTRNNGGGFIIAGFDGATFTRRLAVDRTGVTSITGSLGVVGPVSASSFTGSFKGDGSQLTGVTAAGTVSASSQIDITQTTGYSTFSSSLATVDATQQISINALNAATSSYAINSTIQSQLAGVVSSSAQVKPLLPGGTVTSSAQYPGWVTASSQIDYNSIQNKLSGVVSTSAQVAPLLPNGTVSSSAQYPGWITSSTQVVWSSVNYNSGIVSSSAQTVANIAGQTIAPSVINATGAISGASIQVSGNGTVGGNLTITGTLTATSQSIQYITSSQFNVATNRIIVNTDNALRFGGLTVIDSGSAGKSGSLYWDSVNDRWLYEDVSGGAYTSAIIIAGPQNTGATGGERGLLTGRVPVASGDDHIDTAAASSSIRVDFPSRLTHVESGLFITGALTANGVVTLQGIPSSSAQITALLPAGVYSSSTQLPAGTVSSSTQIVWSSVNYNTGIVSSSTQVAPLLPAGTVSSSAQVVAGVAGQTIAPATVNATNIVSSSVLQTSTNALIGGKLAVTGSTELTGTVTASNLTANQAVFTNASDGLVSNAITGTGNVVMSASPTLTGTITAQNITATGTMLLAGIFSSSAQVDYNSIQNKLSGVVSSSAQVAPLLPVGTVSSSAQYPGWVTSSAQIQLASITGTTFAASNFTFPQQLTVSGVLSGSTSAYLNNTLYSGSVITGIVGPVNNQVVATITTGSFNAAHFDYVINDGTNYRTGTVMSVWSPGSVEFTDTSTNDIGNTAQASFTVDVVSGITRLKFTNVSGTWTVKTSVRAL
jgi:predicted acyltransferase (DUF342 family)